MSPPIRRREYPHRHVFLRLFGIVLGKKLGDSRRFGYRATADKYALTSRLCQAHSHHILWAIFRALARYGRAAVHRQASAVSGTGGWAGIYTSPAGTAFPSARPDKARLKVSEVFTSDLRARARARRGTAL